MQQTNDKSIRNKLMHYDSYERHQAVNMLLNDTHISKILDVGGRSNSLQRFVNMDSVTALNIDKSGDVIYSGKVFPFATCSFDAMVSLDTLEHLEKDKRIRFVEECVRVSKRTVLVAAPYGTPAHAVYEARLDQMYREINGAHHRWLHEHVTYGLPADEDISRIKKYLTDHGFSVVVFYAGDFEWQCRSMERSLRLSQKLGSLSMLGNLLNLISSLAIWRDIQFSTTPYETANRFYIIGQRTS